MDRGRAPLIMGPPSTINAARWEGSRYVGLQATVNGLQHPDIGDLVGASALAHIDGYQAVALLEKWPTSRSLSIGIKCTPGWTVRFEQ